MARPISELGGPVRALFTDVDGTLTSGDAIESATFAAIERLATAGIPTVLVTGRSAGFAHAALKMTSVPVIVSENGAVTFVRDGRRLRKRYGVPEAELPGWRRTIREVASEILAAVPGTQLSSDSTYREVDLAIDWNEEVSLDPDAAQACVRTIRAAGLSAVRSNVHVHIGPPGVDKLTACTAVLREVAGLGAIDRSDVVFVGDSLNDAPMFAGFPRSVGVANIRVCWDELSARPAFLTTADEGEGFRELAEHLLALPR